MGAELRRTAGHGSQRPRTSKSRGGLLVCDPLLAWGSTGGMGVKELLDAVDRAERAAAGSHKALWERLSCRAQALLPELSAPELCRALFAFHRARHRDEELLGAACEAMLGEEDCKAGNSLSANDAALLMKALSRHGYAHLAAVDHLLRCSREDLPNATPADISQLLSAVVRLGVASRLQEEGPHHAGFLGQLFAAARAQLGDAYLPAADLTNLCAAAALLPRCEEAARFLFCAAKRLQGRAESATPPRDVVRRLLSIAAFDEGLSARGGPATVHIEPVVRRLGPDGVAALCQTTSQRLAQRASELDPDACIGALDALARLLPHSCVTAEATAHGRAASATRCGAAVVARPLHMAALRPLLALALQRLPGLQRSPLERTAHAVGALAEVPWLRSEPLLADLLAVLPQELARRRLPGGIRAAAAAA